MQRICTFLVAFCLTIPAFAERPVIGIAPVTVSDSVGQWNQQEGKGLSLGVLREAIDDQLLDAFNGARKFEVVARGDLDDLRNEKALSNRNGPATRDAFQVPGLDFLVVLDIDFYQDIGATLVQPASGRTLMRRDVQLGGVMKIYDADTGVLIESVNLVVTPRSGDTVSDRAFVDGDPTRIAIRQASNQFAAIAVQRVTDVIYPAKVVAVGPQDVTINRGDTGGAQEGQVYELFAPGEPLVDPDTGEVLGTSERFVGAIRIVRVRPNFSVAIVLDQSGPLQKGLIARPAPPMEEMESMEQE
ncbi:MAG: hypothetical protein AAGD32_00100 [Planctomycetota bacterium]